MARIDFVTPADMPAEKVQLLSSLATPEEIDDDYRHLISSAERNVYRIFGHSPAVIEAFRSFARTLWDESELAMRERELITLRVARELDSRYVWHQHARISLTAGISHDEIRALGMNAVSEFTDSEAALLEYARGYVYGYVDDDLHDALAEHYGPRAIVEIGMVAGLYQLISHSMHAIDVELEEEFVGWDLANA